MSKIAVLITDMFEDSEYAKPAEAFKKAGHKLVHVGLKNSETVKGVKREPRSRSTRPPRRSKPRILTPCSFPAAIRPINCGSMTTWCAWPGTL